MAKRQTCPSCGSERCAEILYGFPAFDDEFKKVQDAGKVVPRARVRDGCGLGLVIESGFDNNLSMQYNLYT